MNREEGEECDDGNTVNGDGCSFACKNETVSTNCTTKVPKNGSIIINGTAYINGTNSSTGSYTCGDGNLVSGDGCTSDCSVEYCGDAIVNNNGT